MMKMQGETVYLNIYKCVSDYIKIHHDRFWTFRIAEDLIYAKMGTVSEKYAKRSNHHTAKIALFLNTASIAFRLFAIAQLSLS